MKHAHGLYIPQTLKDACKPRKRSLDALTFGVHTTVKNSGKSHDFLTRGER
jgi:hypothetical protein